MPRFSFLLTSAQVRWTELVGSLADELQAAGHTVETRTEPAPPEPGLVQVVPDPELVVVDGQEPWLARAILLSAPDANGELPARRLQLASRAGAVLEVADRGVELYRQQGIAARKLRPVYPRARAQEPERERDLDLLVIARDTPRRLFHLARYAEWWWRLRTCLVLADNRFRPFYDEPLAHLDGEDQWALLGRARVVVHLHGDQRTEFPWPLALQATAAGAAFAAEHSDEHPPFVAGRHFLSAGAEALGLVAQELLEDGGRRRQLVEAARACAAEEFRPARALDALLAAAEDADRQPLPSSAAAPLLSIADQPRAPEARFFPPPPPDGQVIRRALKQVLGELRETNRRVERLALAQRGQDLSQPDQVDRVSPAYEGAEPAISVLVSVFNYAAFVEAALDSVCRSFYRELELVIVDDASRDASVERVRGWMERHPEMPAILVRHAYNQGPSFAKNTALARARGRFCLVLDADNVLYPTCLPRLLAALEERPDAAFSFAILQRFDGEGPFSLFDTFPWDPERLRDGPYIDALALVRTADFRAVGGYTPSEAELEDHQLWCALAESGRRGVQVREVLARYRVTAGSMNSLTSISQSAAEAKVRQKFPKLMRGEISARS